MPSKRLALGVCLTALGAGTAHAEYLGLLNGRSANPGNLPALSVEGGIATSDFFRTIGARVNYGLSPNLSLFGDIGLIELEETGGADGVGFGIGVLYYLDRQQILPELDMAAKASYHFAELEVDVPGEGSVDIDTNNLALEVLVSGVEPLTAGGLGWYANVGVNLIGGDGPDDAELMVGGGATLPVGPGELYAGVDFLDELTYGAGYRYFLQ